MARAGGADAHLDRHAVADDVEDDGARLGALDDLAQLLRRGVALDLEAHLDAREAVAHLVGETERAADVHVALEGRLDLGQAHLARRRHVDERRCQARGQRVQQGLGRVGAGVDAEQDGRLAGIDGEGLGARGVLLPGAVEALDRGAIVGAVDPVVLDAELKAAERGVGLDGVQRSVHLLGVDAIAGAVEDLGHD